ncbi:MAG: hypothetical protein AMS20_11625 [Gemmatimonas sp. SG8_28]|nr:MAG: hypothetical protein AMS20_11625 [Gemmatimonas sp. SG8_28]
MALELGIAMDGNSLDTNAPGTDWIDALSDDQCVEIFWLYVDPPEPFLESHPRALLGEAMRYALKVIAREARD